VIDRGYQLQRFTVVDDSEGEARPGQEAAQQLRVTTHTNRADLGGGDQLGAVSAAAVGQLTPLQVGSEDTARLIR
jgi:hypothetical protein